MGVDGEVGVDVEKPPGGGLVEAATFERVVREQPFDPSQLAQEVHYRLGVELGQDSLKGWGPRCRLGVTQFPLIGMRVDVPLARIQRWELVHRQPHHIGLQEIVQDDVGEWFGRSVAGLQCIEIVLQAPEIQDQWLADALLLCCHQNLALSIRGPLKVSVRASTLGQVRPARNPASAPTHRVDDQTGSSSKRSW